MWWKSGPSCPRYSHAFQGFSPGALTEEAVHAGAIMDTPTEDAEILVAALRKKQYPVLMVSNVPGDSLFHVQVGPFTDPKEAESMRTRLANDGYNAILKK